MRIAVVGSGVSGLAATWVLNEFSDHEVHLYEADNRAGGHANTVQFKAPGKDEGLVDVDTGFIVFNPSTYPNFLKFLSLYPGLKSRILPTEMTFSVSRDAGQFEWAGNNFFSVFCQPSRLLDVKMWRLLYDVMRFNASARRLVMHQKKSSDGAEDISIGEYLERHGYSDSFRDNYLIPMTAAIWSTPPDKCALDFPAQTLIQFMNNHHLLQVTGKPSWLTLWGGSRTYVEEIVSRLPKSQLHLSTPVRAVSTGDSPHSPSSSEQIKLRYSDGSIETFDHVILACHSDTALKILQEGGRVTQDERKLLGAFTWNRNEAVLHTDTRLMPKSRLAWACWNYLTSSSVDRHGNAKANVDQVALTYWMNDLQRLSEKKYGPILVTLNPPFDPASDKVAGRYNYDHPVLDAQAIRAQRSMHTIQNTRGISYAGAWLNYGFHEDGFTSGLRAAVNLVESRQGLKGSVRPPFEILDADREPKAAWAAVVFDFLERTGVGNILGLLLGAIVVLLKAALQTVLRVDLRHLEEETDRHRRE